MEILNLVEDSSKSEFYPTPDFLVEKMFEGINWGGIHNILEPSAGKGNILRYITQMEKGRHPFNVDAIEIDPNLRAILSYNFGERKNDLKAKKNNFIKELKNKYNDFYSYFDRNDNAKYSYYNKEKKDYVPFEKEEENKLYSFDEELKYFFTNGLHIVHDDFLTYNTYKNYDLIVMNPPFSCGDKHLLKALQMQKRGGTIICLLNAETLKNPYSNDRKTLVNELNKHTTSIEYVSNAFNSAERKTDVEIAIVKVYIEPEKLESDLYNRMKEAEKYEEINADIQDIAVVDFIQNIISQYKVEIKCGMELIDTYKAFKPYMIRSFETRESIKRNGEIETVKDETPILTLSLSDSAWDRYTKEVTKNEFLEKVRYKYWKALLNNPKFVGRLTTKLQEDYKSRVEDLRNYEFSEFNIKTLLAEMNTKIKSGIEEEIIVMFDRLTSEHSYYYGGSTIHYYNGWKTNKAHKIGKKIIIPCNMYDDIFKSFHAYKAPEILGDLERVLNFFDGKMTENVNMYDELKKNFDEGNTKNIKFKYFTGTFHKKGTAHIVFNCPELIERFNIYAGQRKGWLPPCYGYKAYKDMDEEEKAVIDSFQGENAYNEVLENSNYYLGSVTENVLMLGE